MQQTVTLNVKQKMELISMESKIKQKTTLDMFNELTGMGLSQEAVSALKEIATKTANTIGNKVIEIGKIIIMKIIDFIKKNPGFAIGMVIGAAIGALAVFIPFIGTFIAPMSITLGFSIGGAIGSQVDSAMKDLIKTAKSFFSLLEEIFHVLFKTEELA